VSLGEGIEKRGEASAGAYENSIPFENIIDETNARCASHDRLIAA
jgi:hypothetical protein